MQQTKISRKLLPLGPGTESQWVSCDESYPVVSLVVSMDPDNFLLNTTQRVRFFGSGYSNRVVIGWWFFLLETSVLAKPHFRFSPTTITHSNFVGFDLTFLVTTASLQIPFSEWSMRPDCRLYCSVGCRWMRIKTGGKCSPPKQTTWYLNRVPMVSPKIRPHV